MSTYKRELILPAGVIAEMNAFMRSGPTDTEIRRTFTVSFSSGAGGGIEADIKVCGSRDGDGYVDAVLFRDGREVAAQVDDSGHLAGVYVFPVDKDEYVVEIKEDEKCH